MTLHVIWRASHAAAAKPKPIKDWPLTSLKEKLIKIGTKVHGRSRRPHRHETPMLMLFKSNRRQDCVQMPENMARSAP